MSIALGPDGWTILELMKLGRLSNKGLCAILYSIEFCGARWPDAEVDWNGEEIIL